MTRNAVSGLAAAATALALLLCAPAAYAQKEELEEGDKYFEAGRYERAARAYDRAISKWPAQVPPEAYGKRAAIYLIERRYEDGLAFIRDRAEKQYPGAAEVLEYKALLLWETPGMKPNAVKVAEDVVKRRPATYTVQNILGEYFYGREPERAITANEAYLGSRPASLERADVLPRIRLGMSYLAVGRGKEAIDQFELLLRKHRRAAHAEINAHNGLCAAYTSTGEFDRAITTCESIIADPRNIDRNGSVWYNLGQAYLAKKQAQKARSAAREYQRLRPREPRGHVLMGDAYYAESAWENALQSYLEAEKLARGRADQAGVVGIKLGLTYAKLGQPDQAIGKLEAAYQTDTRNVEVARTLGELYLDDRVKDDARALATVERHIGDPARADPDLLILAGRAHYNRNELRDARQLYEQALIRKPKDQKVIGRLVHTINRQAAAAHGRGDLGATERLLGEAAAQDPQSPLTNQNRAVVALERGRCDEAQKYLEPLRSQPAYAAMALRLSGRAYLCQDRPDKAKASDAYAQAERKAIEAANNLLRAEIYTEWAPLLVTTDLEDAVNKLSQAVEFGARTPAVADAAKRNLALALFRRGWTLVRAGRAAEAVADFERAIREPRLLRGTEEAAFEFSLAIAYLEQGDSTRAGRIFASLASAAGQEQYLKAPYDKIGNQFFAAYALYRGGNEKSRTQAAADFAKLQPGARGPFAARVRDLVASSWEFVAYDQFRAGRTGAAAKSLEKAAAQSTRPDAKRAIDHNRAVLDIERNPKAAETALERMAGNPPEALLNLGVLYDRTGRPREAYQAWVKARERGVRSGEIDNWISAKKRIFGF